MRILITTAFCAALAGCGTITRGSNEDVVIDVLPANATIVTSNGRSCTGSCTLSVARKEPFTVTASAPGYETQNVQVRTEVSGAGAASMAGNVLIGGVIGAGVDAATGASLDHKPNPVVIRLKRIGAPADAAPDGPAGVTVPVS